MENDPLNELRKLYQHRYISQSDLADFIKEHHLSAPTKHEITIQKLKLLFSFNFCAFKDYCRTTGELYKYLNRRQQLNDEFIKREQAKSYQIEGNALDPQQIAAVVACEDAELILAPAGSGKTASLLAKLNYLTDHLQIPATDILVIAFTNKVVAELKDRVKQTSIEIRTFHSLGNKIVKSKLKNHHLVSDRKIKAFFHNTIKHIYNTDPDYATLYDHYLNVNNINDEVSVFLNLISHPKNNQQADRVALEELFISILSLQKSERVSLSDLKHRIKEITNQSSRQKSLEFYQLYAPIADKYAKYLEENKLYDFADMLNLATDIIQQMPKNSLKYQYILVDEAQDLSTAKYLLLRAILTKCHKVKLFAVGDDWQSIYRFAGSNLKVLDNFEQIFKRQIYRGLIELTYRFGQPTAKISNKFIQKNPHQSRKKVRPHVNRHTPILIKLNLFKQSRKIPQDYKTVTQILQDLYTEQGSELYKKKIQVISRYNRDIYRLVQEETGKYRGAKLVQLSESGMELEWKLPNSQQKIRIPFCSMHKAKGITRDIIIIINANSGSHGIPATRGNDPVAEILLTKLDDYPYAEERRLWYVAITRAKEKTFIVSDATRISSFVFEINPKLTGAGVRVCPKCHRGIMQERRLKNGKIYYSCSNFTGGCHHTEQ
ncbi:UvrD-helicase domain-containing protein [Candidatus Saccharibacteria bacterium]|nr:UvrD-helicase domain-containing protein [Candidatus Saccharibacteria bacterium]